MNCLSSFTVNHVKAVYLQITQTFFIETNAIISVRCNTYIHIYINSAHMNAYHRKKILQFFCRIVMFVMILVLKMI